MRKDFPINDSDSLFSSPSTSPLTVIPLCYNEQRDREVLAWGEGSGRSEREVLTDAPGLREDGVGDADHESTGKGWGGSRRMGDHVKAARGLGRRRGIVGGLGGCERRSRTWGHDGGREGTHGGDGGDMRAAKRLVEAMRADDEGPPMTSSTIGAVEHMRAA